MNPQNPIQKKVDETMKSLDGLNPAQMPPFFHTRLQARIDNEKADPNQTFSFWPQLRVALFALLIAANVSILWRFQHTPTETQTDRYTQLQSLASEYSLDVPDHLQPYDAE